LLGQRRAGAEQQRRAKRSGYCRRERTTNHASSLAGTLLTRAHAPMLFVQAFYVAAHDFLVWRHAGIQDACSGSLELCRGGRVATKQEAKPERLACGGGGKAHVGERIRRGLELLVHHPLHLAVGGGGGWIVALAMPAARVAITLAEPCINSRES